MLHPSDTENKSVTFQTLKMFFNPQTLKTLYNYFFQHPVHVWLGSSSMCAVFYLCPCQYHCHAPRLQLAPCIYRYCTNEGMRSKEYVFLTLHFLGYYLILLWWFPSYILRLRVKEAKTPADWEYSCRSYPWVRVLLPVNRATLSLQFPECSNRDRDWPVLVRPQG